jgi:hypothetical protein
MEKCSQCEGDGGWLRSWLNDCPEDINPVFMLTQAAGLTLPQMALGCVHSISLVQGFVSHHYEDIKSALITSPGNTKLAGRASSSQQNLDHGDFSS